MYDKIHYKKKKKRIFKKKKKEKKMTFLVHASAHGARWRKLEEGRASLAPLCSRSGRARPSQHDSWFLTSMESFHATGPSQQSQEVTGTWGKGFCTK